MEPRAIFRILLRIMGVFVIKDLLSAAVGVYYYIGFEYDGTYLAIALLGFFLYCSVIYLLLFQTELIINTLRLTKGFETDETKQLPDSSFLLNIALLISALVIIIENVPILFRDLSGYYRAFRANTPNTTEWLAISITRLVLALIIIAYHRQIAAYILRRSESNS